MKTKKLERDFYIRDTLLVARDLLGKELVHRVGGVELAARIIETEAYTGVDDKACHSYGGRRTARTETMYLPGGHAYIYLIYGIYELFNVVTEPRDVPCAVLIRGGVVTRGHDQVARNRFGQPFAELTSARQKDLLNGPGKLTRGLALTREQNAADLLGEALFIADAPPVPDSSVEIGKRVGIDYAEEARHFPYRFIIK